MLLLVPVDDIDHVLTAGDWGWPYGHCELIFERDADGYWKPVDDSWGRMAESDGSG